MKRGKKKEKEKKKMGLLLAFFVVGAFSINCSFSFGTFYDHDSVWACMSSFPFNQSVAQHTVTNLKKAMQLYPFRDIAKNPPAPFETVNLDQELDSIGSSVYQNDMAFQWALRRLFIRLRDAHTNYYAPVPYQFTFQLPVNIFSFMENGRLVFEVSDVLNNASAWTDYNYTSLVGARVLQIDGLDAASYLNSFTDEIGSAKDVQTRFNIALLQRAPLSGYESSSVPWRGLLTYRPHHFASAPQKSSMTMQVSVRGGAPFSVTMPWKATTTTPFFSNEAYMSSYWNDGYNNNKKNKKPVKKRVSSATKNMKALRSIRVKRDPQPLFNSTVDGLGFYLLNDTLVWYQNNFEPADYGAYYQTVVDALLYASQNGISKLILDMSMNGGGDICLGRSMLNLLFGSTPSFGSTDMPVNPLSVSLATTSDVNHINDTEWSANFYQSAVTEDYFSSKVWLTPGISRTRGGVTANYSQLLMISANENCGIPPVLFTKPLFNNSNVLLLTRGFCGSTCALFSDNLHDYQNITAVVVGGQDPAVPMAYRAFPGLQVMDSGGAFGLYYTLDQLLQNTDDQTNTNALSPRRLLTSAAFRLCIREVYKNDVDLDAPLEYTFQPADVHLPFSRETALAPELLWSEVGQKFFQK